MISASYPTWVGKERSNMKRIWLSSWIAGTVAFTGIWWLWHRHLNQQPTPPHEVWKHASPEVPGSHRTPAARLGGARRSALLNQTAAARVQTTHTSHQ